MVILGIICIIIIAVFAILWLYRRISLAKKYIKTTGEIIDFRNMVPLVDKTQVAYGGKYAFSNCTYHGNVYVTVRFASQDGEELTRRYNSSEPFQLKINEHKRSVPQYTAVFPDWRIGKKIKLYYNPSDTIDIIIGRGFLKRSK